MSEFRKIIEDKCMNFAIRIVNLSRFLREERHEYGMADQIFRSGTSIGANMAEAECAISKKVFIPKTYIALKECNETIYWLELLCRTWIIVKNQYDALYTDANELRKIPTSVTQTAMARNS